MTRPSPRELLAETAELAYHFHWPLETILDLEHRDRRVFLDEAAELSVRDALESGRDAPDEDVP
jgi:hypothetical protein